MSLWQTPSWQDMLIASGQSEEYFQLDINFIVQSNAEEKRKAFIEKRRVSLGEYGLFVIGYDGEIDTRLIENLQELCKQENCLFVQIETLDYNMQPLSLNKGEDSGESYKEEKSIIGDTQGFQTGKYYKKFIPPYTAVIDLKQSEEEILAAMHQKGRYNIRLAGKKGVRVQEMENTPENREEFYALMQETTTRDNFAGNNLQYYSLFLEQEHTKLYFAYHENQVIAAGIFIGSGEVMYYYYGASSSEKRNLMAPYLLQWTAISEAKKSGYSLYDFLGVANPGDTDSPLAGVTDFKLKLTPDRRQVSESFLFVHKKWRYKCIQFLKYIKR